MSTQSIELQHPGQLQTQQDWYSADQVLKRVRAIQQLMDAVMKKDTHFGVIPGTKKPTLYKAGSEQILSMFRIAVDPVVEDLSTDDECRIRVLCRMTEIGSSKFLGAGIGECSSSEQKYKWRKIVSKAEWEWFQKNSPDRTRIKFFSYWQNGKRAEGQEEQIRAEVPDVRNTILKMAKKRAQIDATLTVTGCSDMFQQDLEDLPPEVAADFSDEREHQEPIKKTTAKPVPAPVPQQAAQPATVPVQGEIVDAYINDKQLKLVCTVQSTMKISDNDFKEWLGKQGINSRKHIPKDMMNSVLDWLDPKFTIHTKPDADGF